jgi:hypothetical protein
MTDTDLAAIHAHLMPVKPVSNKVEKVFSKKQQSFAGNSLIKNSEI